MADNKWFIKPSDQKRFQQRSSKLRYEKQKLKDLEAESGVKVTQPAKQVPTTKKGIGEPLSQEARNQRRRENARMQQEGGIGRTTKQLVAFNTTPKTQRTLNESKRFAMKRTDNPETSDTRKRIANAFKNKNKNTR